MRSATDIPENPTLLSPPFFAKGCATPTSPFVPERDAPLFARCHPSRRPLLALATATAIAWLFVLSHVLPLRGCGA